MSCFRDVDLEMTIDSHIKIYQNGPEVHLGFSVSWGGNPNELLGQPNKIMSFELCAWFSFLI